MGLVSSFQKMKDHRSNGHDSTEKRKSEKKKRLEPEFEPMQYEYVHGALSSVASSQLGTGHAVTQVIINVWIGGCRNLISKQKIKLIS